MSDQEESELTKELERRLQERKTKVRNKAAFGALYKLIPHVGTALHHALTAGDDAEAKEKARIQLDLMAELLVRIDSAISDVSALAAERGVEWTEVGGVIKLSAKGGKTAAGVHITEGSGPVRFQQGAHIDVSTEDVQHSAGLVIGGRQAKKEDENE